MKTIRIFISSPGDVQVERQIAGKVVERLQGKYWSFVRLEDVFWEEKVIRSTAHYQDELIHPGNCEIVVGVLWSRLGSPLPEKFRLQSGSATTGTEWEIEMAFSAYEERLSQLLAEGLPEAKARQMAKPDIVIYRRSSERERHSDPEQEAEAQDQQQKLEHYLKQHFKNADHDSTIKRPITGYSTLDEFEAKLTRNLEELILRTIPDLKPGFEPPPISGSPFKGLRAFGFDDSDRFFGRNRQIREIQDLLQRRAERACPFVLIYGASGYGKSSLMRAGLAPVLTRPGGAGEGKDLWRRVLMQPAVGEGSLTERLVRLLAASPSLEEVVLHKENGTYALSGLSEWQSKFKQAEVSEPQVRWDVSLLTRVLESEELREQGVCLIRICLEEMTTHLLVQVDQLEEVFTTSGMTDPERETFFAVLAALMETGRVWVVATMRSEFFPRIAESPELRRLVGKDGGYILPPPDRQALREIIRYPALAARLGYQRRTGPVIIGKEPVKYEDLDDEILADAESSPDALPLLEFCLQELYESILDPQDPKQQRRLSELLRWQDYAKLGGLKGAIAQRADGVFANLADEVKRAAPMVFASLVRVETGKGTVVRQRSSLETLKQSHAFAGRLLEAMRAAHLLVSDEEAGCAMVTLAHEALVSHWGRLSTWVADHRGDLLARQRLREQAELWESHGRQKSYLLAEARLAEAERVMQVGLFQLEPEVEALIHQSQQRSQKQVWALRVAVAFFALVALAAVLLGLRSNSMATIASEEQKRTKNSIRSSVKNMTEFAMDSNNQENVESATRWLREAVALDEFDTPSPATAAANHFLFNNQSRLPEQPILRFNILDNHDKRVADFFEGGLVLTKRKSSIGFWDLRFGDPTWIELPDNLKPMKLLGRGGHVLSIRNKSELVVHQISDHGLLVELRKTDSLGEIFSVATSSAGHFAALTKSGGVYLFSPEGEKHHWKLQQEFNEEQEAHLALSATGDKLAVLFRGALLRDIAAHIWVMEKQTHDWKVLDINLDRGLSVIGHLGFSPNGSNLWLIAQSGLIHSAAGHLSMLHFPLENAGILKAPDRQVNYDYLKRARTLDGGQWITYRQLDNITGKPHGIFLSQLDEPSEEKLITLGDPTGTGGPTKLLLALSPDGTTFIQSRGGLVQLATISEAADSVVTLDVFEEVKDVCYVDARRVVILTGGKHGNQCHFYKLSGLDYRAERIGPVQPIKMKSPIALLPSALAGRIAVIGTEMQPEGVAGMVADIYCCATQRAKPDKVKLIDKPELVISERCLKIEHVLDDVYAARIISSEEDGFDHKSERIILGHLNDVKRTLNLKTQTQGPGYFTPMGNIIIKRAHEGTTYKSELFDPHSLDSIYSFGSAWDFFWTIDKVLCVLKSEKKWLYLSNDNGKLLDGPSGDLPLNGTIKIIYQGENPHTIVALFDRGSNEEAQTGGAALITLKNGTAVTVNKIDLPTGTTPIRQDKTDTCLFATRDLHTMELCDVKSGEIISKSILTNYPINLKGGEKHLAMRSNGELEFIDLRRPFNRHLIASCPARVLKALKTNKIVMSQAISDGCLMQIGSIGDDPMTVLVASEKNQYRIGSVFQGYINYQVVNKKEAFQVINDSGSAVYLQHGSVIANKCNLEPGEIKIQTSTDVQALFNTFEFHSSKYYLDSDSIFMSRKPLARKATLNLLDNILMNTVTSPTRQEESQFSKSDTVLASTEIDPALFMAASDFSRRSASPFSSKSVRQAVSDRILQESALWNEFTWKSECGFEKYPAEHPLTPLAVAYLARNFYEKTHYTDAQLHEFEWISFKRLMNEFPSEALSPTLQQDCLLAAKWFRKSGLENWANDLVFKCLDLNPQNLEALRTCLAILKTNDDRAKKIIVYLANHPDSVLDDVLKAAYKSLQLNNNMLALEILQKAKNRYASNLVKQRLVGWIYINIGRSAEALALFESALRSLTPNENPDSDLLAGLALSRWLSLVQDEATKAYKQLIEIGRAQDEPTDWADASVVDSLEWTEIEKKTLEEVRQATLAKFPELRN